MIERLLNGAARPTPSARPSVAPKAALALVLAAALATTACETLPSGPLPERVGSSAPTESVPQGEAVVDRVITPPHRAQEADSLVRVGLLLPLSAQNPDMRGEAFSMLNAAQLALFETGADRIVLIPKDTGGRPEGARSQAREALREGADLILGPLDPAATRAAAEEAAAYNKPVIAFTDNRSLADTGIYLLSVTPEEEVSRIVSYAASQGLITFASFTPDNIYGERVRVAADEAARLSGGFLATFEVFPAGGDASMIDLPARRLARYDSRLAARNADEEDEFELPYDAVILPEGGLGLLQLAPLLPFYDVDPREVRFLGTSLWRDPQVAREPSLAGGWFPGPDSDALDMFSTSYQRTFGEEPTRLAPLAYDAVLMTASLTRGMGAAGLTPQGFERPTGFRGADGLFRFGEDRIAEHALAIYQVQNGGFNVIDPAPDSFEPMAF
jgi:ABC-type branched-subunit amino acid transport system substrate-binding protein